MPRRRWADWATCVTRTGLASAYLFEMNLAYRLVTGLVASDDEPSDIVDAMFDNSNRLLVWDDRKSRSIQNMGPTIRRLASAGTACQKCLVDLKALSPDLPQPSDFDAEPDGLTQWLGAARKALEAHDSEARKIVATALDEKPSASSKNVWETIRYSLISRHQDQSLDLYSLLQAAGPSTWVEPGQEWLVTIASLCAGEPGRPTRLVELNAALSSLGLAAAHTTLVPRLEAFGLCRSSHDADDAVELQPAF